MPISARREVRTSSSRRRALGGEIAGSGAQGKGEEDGQPVERLAPGRHDRVDRQSPLARVPGREDHREDEAEHNVVVTSETPKLSVKLSVISVPTTLISTTASQ